MDECINEWMLSDYGCRFLFYFFFKTGYTVSIAWPRAMDVNFQMCNGKKDNSKNWIRPPTPNILEVQKWKSESKHKDKTLHIESLRVWFRGRGTVHTCSLVPLYPGLSKDSPPPEPELRDTPSRGPPPSQPEGEGQQWSICLSIYSHLLPLPLHVKLWYALYLVYCCLFFNWKYDVSHYFKKVLKHLQNWDLLSPLKTLTSQVTLVTGPPATMSSHMIPVTSPKVLWYVNCRDTGQSFWEPFVDFAYFHTYL